MFHLAGCSSDTIRRGRNPYHGTHCKLHCLQLWSKHPIFHCPKGFDCHQGSACHAESIPHYPHEAPGCNQHHPNPLIHGMEMASCSKQLLCLGCQGWKQCSPSDLDHSLWATMHQQRHTVLSNLLEEPLHL